MIILGIGHVLVSIARRLGNGLTRSNLNVARNNYPITVGQTGIAVTIGRRMTVTRILHRPRWTFVSQKVTVKIGLARGIAGSAYKFFV